MVAIGYRKINEANLLPENPGSLSGRDTVACKKLKPECGTGDSVEDRVIEIQQEHRGMVTELLKKLIIRVFCPIRDIRAQGFQLLRKIWKSNKSFLTLLISCCKLLMYEIP